MPKAAVSPLLFFADSWMRFRDSCESGALTDWRSGERLSGMAVSPTWSTRRIFLEFGEAAVTVGAVKRLRTKRRKTLQACSRRGASFLIEVDLVLGCRVG